MIAWSSETVTRALRFAAEAHNAQKVPGTKLPYLLHLGQVMTEVAAALQVEPADDGELSILCAVLHDTVEDTAVTVEEVAARFGDRVAAGVSALSKDSELPKPQRMPDSLRRIRLQSHAVWKVKLADRITNLQSPPSHWTRTKAMAYREEAGTILEALGDSSPVLAARIRAKIEAYGDLLPDD
jgi:(p)ppGpp synthase/HD superfamily hydrolase